MERGPRERRGSAHDRAARVPTSLARRSCDAARMTKLLIVAPSTAVRAILSDRIARSGLVLDAVVEAVPIGESWRRCLCCKFYAIFDGPFRHI